MDTPPLKPPRQKGGKTIKDELQTSGFLVNVIKTLGFSETHEERQNEKVKIEKEFKKSDQRLNDLVSKHDQDLTRVLPLFSQVSTQIATSREKIHSVKENLIACKQLLQCKRDEIQKLWTDAVQHKFVLEMLEEINDLRKVPSIVSMYCCKRQYLHATKKLTQAIENAEGPLGDVDGLSDLRADLQTRKMHLYNKLHEELNKHLYQNSTAEVLSNFQRQNSTRNSAQQFQRNFGIRRSTDRAEANARVRKALVEMTQGFDLEKSEVVDDADLVDPELSTTYFISIIVECFAMLEKVPDSIETIRVQIQNQLLEIVRVTTNQMISLNLPSIHGTASELHPLLALLEVIFKQFKAVAQTHSLLLKNILNVTQRYSVQGCGNYDLPDFWHQAQSVLQLLLTDYLDIQNASSEETSQNNFNESNSNINSFFLRRKVQSKKALYKFDKSAWQQSDSLPKEHRRNASDMSNDENIFSEVYNSMNSGKKRERNLICKADPSLIRKIYIPLVSYIHEIEGFMKCKSGLPCNLSDFVSNYVKETYLSKGHYRNLQMTIESLSKNQDAWRTIITPEEMKQMNLDRPLLQSTVHVERQISETKRLIHDLPNYSEDLLKMVCSLLKTYRETCQAAYRGIVQPDSEDKRIYSVAWLKDDDINRFLKSLPNWTDLKTSSNRSKLGSKQLRRQSYEPSEEESPTQVQQRNVREAEMLTSNLGEGGISQSEILSDISVLKELAILQESMEWFSSRISDFASDLRRPIINGFNVNGGSEYSSVTIKDGTIKVLTNLALEFDELANTCLLVLHLEVRVQCFHYLRTKIPPKSNNFIGHKEDILEPDAQVLKLTKVLADMDEALNATLHPRKTRYIFEGLAHLASRILIQASNYMENVDQINIQRMCRNSLALQQTLSSITASREVALDQARNFYELLCMEPDEILTSIVEKGSQFTEMQYLNALNLSSKSRGINDANSLASYQQKLSDILGAKPADGVIV
ncbi:exocyst complex component 4 isoform X2 [Condylostylus longicornis]|uniref:exocyst complex component 4 isoform X2 n=1 Tax=Condylostylus longicornis TaxID=2530218 RepID=UPI00244E1C49|nr:exocyst complex component 4 isoform X2 [Condylostylus longicornis]